MPAIIILYYSRTGNTEKMAADIARGVKEEGLPVRVKTIEEIEVEELLDYGGIIIGSPTYYGTMAGEVKSFLDTSVRLHGRLEGKVGAAFSSAGNLGGGHETTVLSILEAFLIHGMIIQGSHQGAHYGATAVGRPDERAETEAYHLGRTTAALVKMLFEDEVEV